MNQIIIPEVDSKAIADQVNPIVSQARSLVVNTQEDDEIAQKGLLVCAKIEKFIRALYKAPKAVLDKAHKDLCAEEAKWLDPLEEAKKLYFEKHNAYVAEQERIARETAAKSNEPVGSAQVEAPIAVTSVKGVGKPRVFWTAEVFDLKALIKWVTARLDQDPGVAAYLEPSMTALNSVARAQKADLKIDGVRAVEKMTTNIRV